MCAPQGTTLMVMVMVMVMVQNKIQVRCKHFYQYISGNFGSHCGSLDLKSAWELRKDIKYNIPIYGVTLNFNKEMAD
jgi:hypothetical protein